MLEKLLNIFNSNNRIKFKYRGQNVDICRGFTYSNESNISIGDNSVIGLNCIMYATNAEISIGKYVMLGPNVSIITGEHRTDLIGEYMRNITPQQKLPKNDKPVTIEDDVWIGAGAIILKGVTIGRGSIIHAGAVVTKKVRPYTVYVNEKLKMNRFTKQQIEQHELLIKQKYGIVYPEYTPKDSLFY